MQELRVEAAAKHERTPLYIRASLPKTFLGLGVFVETGLLFCGIYMLADAIAKPLEANQAGVIAAAAVLALALVLLFYLFQPLRKTALARACETPRARAPEEHPPLTIYGKAMQNRIEATRALQHKVKLPGPM
jgi:hypothetical protein